MAINTIIKRHLTPLLLIICTLPLSFNAQSDDLPHSNEKFFANTLPPEQLIADGLEQAKRRDQLLLVALGAQWCHDSRALATQLQSPEVNKLIESDYTFVVLNAGWLENYSAVLEQFNHPGYFGTPTLLIINPHTKSVVNRASIQRWQSAHSESASSLSHYLALHLEQGSLSHVREHIPEALKQFETEQTNRLYNAYRIIGPLLEHEVESGEKNERLDALWDEVRKFRYQLQNDLVKAHENPRGRFVEYPQLSFEQTDEK